MIRDNCIYRNQCDNYNSGECRNTCLRYDSMDAMLKYSQIPKRYLIPRNLTLYPADLDMDAYARIADIRGTIKDFVSDGKQLYIHSKHCGNGKTTWSVKLMLQYFNEVWLDEIGVPRGVFINVTDFIFRVKDSFSKYDDELEELKQLIKTVDLVIWDDIGTYEISKYDYELLYVYLNYRTSNGLSNIYTSGEPASTLRNLVGDKIADRMITQDTTVIEFRGGSNR